MGELQFDLSLESRTEDRVFVSVLLAPRGDETAIDGVAVGLITKTGEPVSNRLLLPIAGQLRQPMVSTVEIRATTELPKGAKVVGVAWKDGEQWEASCPADPGTQLEAHLRGREVLRPRSDNVLESMLCGERARLAAVFPWLTPCEPAEPKVVETEQAAPPEEFRHFCEGLGLDEDDTDWLQDLLAEDE